MSEQDIKDALAKMLGAPERVSEPPAAEMAKLLLSELPIYEQHLHSRVFCPFKRGQLVTPRIGTYARDAGTPYLVLEARRAEPPLFDAEQGGGMRDGLMPNMRVGRWSPVGMVAMWVESWAFETFNGEVAS